MFIINKPHAQAVTPERAMLGFTPTVQVNINPFPLESQLGVTLKPFPEQSGFKLLINKMTERISIERERSFFILLSETASHSEYSPALQEAMASVMFGQKTAKSK